MVIRRITKAEADEVQPEPKIPTVSELTRQISDLLEGRFDQVVVQGEISGLSRAASGHTYFSLKDENAVIGSVLWRSRSIGFVPRDGMKVIATGRITVYGPRGQYQLDCQSLLPLGQGDLQLAFERLKARLQAEGLFDQERKRTLPLFPRRIGVVTSRTGAAIRDILTTLRRRMPAVQVVLRPALVQGATAAADIALAIGELNDLGDLDLLIVGRGGGSIEDLWAFNEEAVARAIAASRVPIISAVGHEIDFTIADFVADRRAATPTAAAEIAVRDAGELIEMLRETEQRLSAELQEKLAGNRRELLSLLRSRGLSRPVDLVRSHQQRVDDLQHRATLGLNTTLIRSSEQLRLMEATLQALNPMNVLARGYAIIERDGHPVAAAAELQTDDRIKIRMHDGERGAVIEKV